MDSLLSPAFNLSVCQSSWLWGDSADVSLEKNRFPLLFLEAVCSSELVFPSPLPQEMHLSQSKVVSEVGVVGVKSYMTTPINLVILNTTLACNWVIFQFSFLLLLSFLFFYYALKLSREVCKFLLCLNLCYRHVCGPFCVKWLLPSDDRLLC